MSPIDHWNRSIPRHRVITEAFVRPQLNSLSLLLAFWRRFPGQIETSGEIVETSSSFSTSRKWSFFSIMHHGFSEITWNWKFSAAMSYLRDAWLRKKCVSVDNGNRSPSSYHRSLCQTSIDLSQSSAGFLASISWSNWDIRWDHGNKATLSNFSSPRKWSFFSIIHHRLFEKTRVY